MCASRRDYIDHKTLNQKSAAFETDGGSRLGLRWDATVVVATSCFSTSPHGSESTPLVAILTDSLPSLFEQDLSASPRSEQPLQAFHTNNARTHRGEAIRLPG